METLASCRQRLEDLLRRAKALVEAQSALKEAFAEGAEHLRRRDQADCLRALKARVCREVEHIQHKEMSDYSGFTKAKLTGSAVRLTTGGLAAAADGYMNPFWIGVCFAGEGLADTPPFGEVEIAVGAPRRPG